MDAISFTVEGNSVPKGRPRACRTARGVKMFTPAKTEAYESLVRLSAAREMIGKKPFEQPVSLKVSVFLEIPKSWSKKKKEDAESGKIMPASKPDLDNIIKALTDRMNEIIYNDDSQIIDIQAKKRYGTSPCVIISVCDYKMFCSHV